MHVLGIHVAELSIDGIYTIDSYLNHTEGIGPKNLTASIYKRQWDRGMLKSHNLYFIGLDCLDELTNC